MNLLHTPTSIDPSSILALVILPGEPFAKERARLNHKTGAVYTPRKTAKHEEAIGWATKTALLTPNKQPNKQDRIGVRTAFYLTKKRRDIDNMLKAVLDGCNKVAWHDDTQVCEVIAWRFMHCESARTEFLIYRLREEI
jgi:Holliday junction resolvase RusA-like endonuclease